MDVTFQSGFRVTEKLRKSRGFPHAPVPTRAESPPAAPRLPWYVCRSRRAYADPASRTASRCTLGRGLVRAAGWDQRATACGPASRSQSAAAAPGACVLRPDPLPATDARNRPCHRDHAFPECHVAGIAQRAAFSDWRLSLSGARVFPPRLCTAREPVSFQRRVISHHPDGPQRIRPGTCWSTSWSLPSVASDEHGCCDCADVRFCAGPRFPLLG